MEALLERLGRWIVRRRRLAASLVIAVSAAAALAMGLRLAGPSPVDFTPQALFADSGEDIATLRAIEEIFGREDNDLVVVLEGRFDTPEFVAALEKAHEALADHPRVQSVDSLAEAQLMESGAGALRARGVFEDRSAAEGLKAAAVEPGIAGALIAVDGSMTILRVRVAADVYRLADLTPVVHALIARALAVEWPSDVQVRFTGIPHVRVEVVGLMLADQLRFLPLVSVLFLLVTWFLFRRLSIGLAPLVGVWLAALWAVGALLATGLVFNLLSLLIPVLVVVIATSDGIHLVARYREEIEAGAEPETAMGSAVGRTGTTLFLTTFTTAAAFGSLAVADSSVVRAFGIESAVAVLIAWPAMVLGVPTWLAFMRPPDPAVGGRRRWPATLNGFIAARPGRVALGVAALAGLAAWAGLSVRTDSRLLELYAGDHPTAALTRGVEEKLGGVIPVFVHLRGPSGAVLEPAALALMAEAEGRLRAAGAGWTFSPAALLERVHALLGGDGVRPATRAGAMQELLLAESAVPGRLGELISGDRTDARVIGLAVDGGGPRTAAARRALQAWADAAFAPLGIEATVSGDGFVASTGLTGLMNDLLASVGLVFVVVFFVLLFVTRDLAISLLAAIPNALPLVFTLGALGVLGRHIQPSNLICFSVAIGLAVDDTLHFLARHREAVRGGASARDAIGAALAGSGPPIVFTSVLLIAGFGVLMLSDVQSTLVFGMLVSVTLMAAVLADLVLLPALLYLVARRA